MSSDMMIVCKEDESNYEGKNLDKAFFIGESSMGDPHTNFGKWFGARYDRGPSILQQIAGDRSIDWLELTTPDVIAIREALETMIMDDRINKIKFIVYLESHIGKHISTENW